MTPPVDRSAEVGALRDEHGFTIDEPRGGHRFTVLNDAPIDVTGDADLLGAAETGRRLALLVLDSREAAPFTLAIDAAWGTGKSTLLHAVDTALAAHVGVRTVWFNAWTAERAGALEGLIKSVLLSFDRNVLRRAVRNLAGRQQLLGVRRAALLLGVSVFGLSRVVDDLWKRLAADARTRNQIRDVVRGMAENWLARSRPAETRLLVVFVDDLDRCASDQVVEVCEAMKLYLDVPGVVFVLACDGAAVLQAVRDRPGGQAGDLDKIIQVHHRVAPPPVEQARRLVEGYAAASGTGELFDAEMCTLVIEHTGGNPRAVKRLINCFVLEYRLRPDWQQADARNLLKIILLQQFYPEFYRLFVDSPDTDLLGDFLAYQSFRQAVDRNDSLEKAVEARVFDLFTSRGLAPPGEDLGPALDQLQNRLPAEFSRLADERLFTSLLAGFVNAANTSLVSRMIRRRPLTNLSAIPVLVHEDPAELAGVRVLWVDDEARETYHLARELRRRGAALVIANNRDAARVQFAQFAPTVLISDLRRFNDDEAGFTDLESFRTEQHFGGPVIFFTRSANVEQAQRAAALGTRITTRIEEILAWLRQSR